jgi:signal peptidase I
MLQHRHGNRRFDTKAFFYRSAIQIICIVGIGLFIKFTIFDIIECKGEQMQPTIKKGDWLLVFRTPYISFVKFFLKPDLQKPVIFTFHDKSDISGCLRTAGIGGDTVSIDSGIFKNTNKQPLLLKHSDTAANEVIPEDFSPRDYFKPYRVPVPGDTLNFDSLSLRDFFFALSVARQENPHKKLAIKPILLLDGSPTDDYIIKEFSLYKGSIDSIPDSLQYDWFFWDRLKGYLEQSSDSKKIGLTFNVTIDSTAVKHYKVKKSYLFLIADNWTDGFDSRYFGPVKANNITGRAFIVVWSYGQEPKGNARLRLNRLGRIIK